MPKLKEVLPTVGNGKPHKLVRIYCCLRVDPLSGGTKVTTDTPFDGYNDEVEAQVILTLNGRGGFSIDRITGPTYRVSLIPYA